MKGNFDSQNLTFLTDLTLTWLWIKCENVCHHRILSTFLKKHFDRVCICSCLKTGLGNRQGEKTPLSFDLNLTRHLTFEENFKLLYNPVVERYDRRLTRPTRPISSEVRYVGRSGRWRRNTPRSQPPGRCLETQRCADHSWSQWSSHLQINIQLRLPCLVDL